MRSVLRESYGGTKADKPKAVEKNMEVEDGKEKVLGVINGDGMRPKEMTSVAVTESKLAKSSLPAENVKGKEGGPGFSDLGGMKGVLEELKMEGIVPLYHPQIPIWLGVKPMAGILLHGPPGCGKTKLAHAIANETGVPFYKISATEVVSGVSGASEENIRELFLKAEKTAPSIVFIDEIDAIASKRENLQREMERRIVTQLMTCMDESHSQDFGMDLETGFLLYGPPGCGKTLIAKAVANEVGANFIHIKGPELLNKYVGESDLPVQTIFSRARTCSPCILFLMRLWFYEQVDALTTKRGKEGGWVVERLINQLLIEFDGADQRNGVYVIGATNRPEVIDQAFLRPGRFGKLLYVPLASPIERGLILQALARKNPIDASVDLSFIAKSPSCENLSGADLSALINEAAMAVREALNKWLQLEYYTFHHQTEAL